MSLTESCIAVAIAATCMAMTTPSLVRARQAYLLKSAARDVASKLHFARVSAVVRNTGCRVTVTSARSYEVECSEGAWETVDTIELPEGFTIEANARPQFHGRGHVAPAATLTVRDESNRAVRVIVNVNGRVRIE